MEGVKGLTVSWSLSCVVVRSWIRHVWDRLGQSQLLHHPQVLHHLHPHLLLLHPRADHAVLIRLHHQHGEERKRHVSRERPDRQTAQDRERRHHRESVLYFRETQPVKRLDRLKVIAHCVWCVLINPLRKKSQNSRLLNWVFKQWGWICCPLASQKEKKKGNIGSIQSWDIERKERRASGWSREIQSVLQDVSGSVWCFASQCWAVTSYCNNITFCSN